MKDSSTLLTASYLLYLSLHRCTGTSARLALFLERKLRAGREREGEREIVCVGIMCKREGKGGGGG